MCRWGGGGSSGSGVCGAFGSLVSRLCGRVNVSTEESFGSLCVFVFYVVIIL